MDENKNTWKNNFSAYEAIDIPKIKYSFMNEPEDISDWALGVSESGIPVIKGAKIPENSAVRQNTTLDTSDNLYYDWTTRKENYFPSKSLNGNLKEAMYFFMSKGFPSHQAAGIVGNLMGESNLNPTAINSKSKAYGIALWLGSRKAKLFSKYGMNPSFKNLLDFIWEELNTTENKSLKNLLKTTNLNDAIEVFMSLFERPSEKEMDESRLRRINYGLSLLS